MEKEKIPMPKKRGWNFFPALLVVLLPFPGLYAQVTVGSGIPPIPGALLDLKENSSAGANSVRGLNMPRVMLTDERGLFPMFEKGTSDASNYKDREGKTSPRATADKEHTGLTVYNLSDTAPFCPGLYVWDGTKWERLGQACPGVVFNPDYNVNTGATTLYVGAAFTGGTDDNLSRGTGTSHSQMPAGVFRYTGGTGRYFEGYTASVEGITVTVPAGTLATGAGELPVFVSGSPSALTAGKAFDIPLPILGQQLYVRVSVGCGAYTGTPSIPSILGDPAWLQFQCFNLGAKTSLDNPFVWTSDGDNIDNDIKGYLFQWGRPADGHQKRSSGVEKALSASDTPGADYFIRVPDPPYDWRSGGESTSRWGDGFQDEDMAKAGNDPCPAGWKVPSQKQWDSIFRGGTAPGSATANTWLWTGYGYRVGPSLYLPAAGHRHYYDGTVKFVGQNGYYWSSTVAGTGSYGLVFTVTDGVYAIKVANSEYRSMGFSVRCVRE